MGVFPLLIAVASNGRQPTPSPRSKAVQQTVIVGHEEYESLIETLNILADSDTVTAIAEAEADLAAGDLVPLD